MAHTIEFIREVHDKRRPEIAKQIRKDLKDFFWNRFTFSVTCPSGCIDIRVLSGDIEFYTEKYLEATRIANEWDSRDLWDIVIEMQINWEHYTSEWERTMTIIKRIRNIYNHNNSDSMTDYFDVNYYGQVLIWNYDNPYRCMTKKITKEQFDNIHPDYKWERKNGIYSVLENINGSPVSVPVLVI